MKNKIILSANHTGISRALFNGKEWIKDQVLKGVDVRCLVHHKAIEDTIFAGTQGNGIFISEDKGKNWGWLGMEKQMVKAITTHQNYPDLILAGVKPANIWKSVDGGKNWNESKSFRRMPQELSWFSPAEPPYSAYVLGLDISPSNNKEIIAGIEFGGVHLSADGGQTWEGHMEGAIRDCHNLTYHRTNGKYVYQGGGTGTGAAISRDGGRTWTQEKEGLDRHYGWAVASDPKDPEMWYASVSTGPMKAHSSDHAEACIFRKQKNQPWVKLKGGLPEIFDHMPYSMITTDEPGFIATGLSNGDILWSRDYGEKWEKLGINMGVSDRMIFV